MAPPTNPQIILSTVNTNFNLRFDSPTLLKVPMAGILSNVIRLNEV